MLRALGAALVVATTLVDPSASFTPAGVLAPSQTAYAARHAVFRSYGWRAAQTIKLRRASVALRAESTATTVEPVAAPDLDTAVAKAIAPEQAGDEVSAALEALRLKRAEKLARGQTVFFDYPTTTGKDECGPEESEKPLLLYLTGMDGLGVSGEPQFKDLSNLFEVRRLQVLAEDRRDFDELVDFVLHFMDDWQRRSGGRSGKVVLMGESFGGLLASGVALKNQTMVQGLCLVNPATSFDRTDWPTIGPLLAALPSQVPLSEMRLKDIVTGAPGAEALLKILPLPVPDKSVGELAYAAVAGGALFARALDSKLVGTLVDLATGQGSEIVGAAQSGTLPQKLQSLSEGSVKLLDSLLATLPADTVAHRLENCLGLGARRIKGRMSEIAVPTVVVAGRDDNILPSADEASRLEREMPQCTKVVIRAQGHLVLGAGSNISRILIDSSVVPPPLRRDRVNDFVPPSPEEASAAVQSLQGLRQVYSPVFYSLDPESGKVVRGLSGIPDKQEGKPMLFIGNHQTLSLDLGLLVSEVYQEKGVLMRGLAHPVLFNQGGGGFGGVPGAAPQQDAGGAAGRRGEVGGSGFFEKFGAVPVSGRNAAKLMRRGDAVLLFPGGVKETIPAMPEDKYRLMWPDKSEFVRLAAKYNATIVPFGAIGAAETLNVVATAQELEKLRSSPAGQLLPRLPAQRTGQADMAPDFGGPGGVDPERLRFPPSPLAVPAPLWEFSRMYFYFGEPLSALELDVSSEAATDATYNEVKARVESCIDYLRRKRGSDPYKDLLVRSAYERLNGEQAPSFEP